MKKAAQKFLLGLLLAIYMPLAAMSGWLHNCDLADREESSRTASVIGEQGYLDTHHYGACRACQFSVQHFFADKKLSFLFTAHPFSFVPPAVFQPAFSFLHHSSRAPPLA